MGFSPFSLNPRDAKWDPKANVIPKSTGSQSQGRAQAPRWPRGITDISAEVPLDLADGGGLASHSPLTPKSHSLGHHLVPPLSTWANRLISYLLLCFPWGGHHQCVIWNGL